jgi:hypothetical protein
MHFQSYWQKMLTTTFQDAISKKLSVIWEENCPDIVTLRSIYLSAGYDVIQEFDFVKHFRTKFTDETFLKTVKFKFVTIGFMKGRFKYRSGV